MACKGVPGVKKFENRWPYVPVLCALDMDTFFVDNLLVINPYDPYRKMQQWLLSGKKITNRHDPKIAIQVGAGSLEAGSQVTTGEYTADNRQHWDISHV